MKFVEKFKRSDFARFCQRLKKDFIPAYEAWFLGRFHVSPLKSSKIMNRAGGHSYMLLFERLLWVVMIVGMIIGIFIGVTATFSYFLILLLLIFLMLLIPVLLYQSDNCLLGYLGERAVADELEKLGRRQWRVFHNLEIEYSNIDHIIVCSKGVFCVETKTLRKKPKVNEKLVFKEGKIFRNQYPLKHDPIKQARRNAQWLYNYINNNGYKSTGKKLGFVVPIIAFPGWLVESSLSGDTVPCNPEQIPDIFKGRKDTLSEDDFNNICKLLEEKNQMDLSDVK